VADHVFSNTTLLQGTP